MRTKSDLFVGITSWNSESFLAHCINAVKRTTSGLKTHIVVLDNLSTDHSVDLARQMGVEIISRRGSQGQALIDLLNMSRSEYTLLIHADVILLSGRWFEVCREAFSDNVALISPQDIGCGPYLRTWGTGMPESSFLLFRTKLARSARQWFSVQRFKVRWPYRGLDFFGEHVTYNIPASLKRGGLSWKMMDVHTSSVEVDSLYEPNFQPKYWQSSWGYYRYGLANFYSINGEITHYHNWFDRVAAESSSVDPLSTASFPAEGGFPLAFVRSYTERFLEDLKSGRVIIPEISSAQYVSASLELRGRELATSS